MIKRILIFILIISCFATVKAGNSNPFFPTINGWKLSDSISVFNSESLWNIIDGAADIFLQYGFEEMKMAEYTRPDSTYIMVECYRHKTPELTFGIYSQEKPTKGNYIKKGAEGYQEQGMLDFLLSCYYVKIRSLSSETSVQNTINEIADGLVKSIDKPGELPKVLDIFPSEGKIEHSEQYISNNFLGYHYFDNAYKAGYEVSGKRFILFLIKRDNSDQISEIIANYYKFLKINFKKNDESIYNVKDPHNGEITLIINQNTIGGIVNIDDSKIRKQYITIYNAKLK